MSDLHRLRMEAALRAVVDSYEDAGCDGCGTIEESAYEQCRDLLPGCKPISAEPPMPAQQMLDDIHSLCTHLPNTTHIADTAAHRAALEIIRNALIALAGNPEGYHATHTAGGAQ